MDLIDNSITEEIFLYYKGRSQAGTNAALIRTILNGSDVTWRVDDTLLY
jgi:hypothetical protein